jgi:DNA topoisomerase-1
VHPDGHIQAVGRDQRGRKQYRYHPRWTAMADDAKYHKMIRFAKALPKIRAQIAKDLALHGLPREKVLAAVLGTLERTLIRVGNEEYAEQNHSYGLTTLKDQHAKINGKKVHFEFRGKSGVKHEVDLDDPKLSEIIRRCRDLPGQELFQYVNESGEVCDVNSTDMNEYLRQISGGDFTTKDFRTWSATVLAACALCDLAPCKTAKEVKKNVVQAIEEVAGRLGNTKAVCRKSYVHPGIVEMYSDGSLLRAWAHRSKPASDGSHRLSAQEAAVLRLIQKWMTHRRSKLPDKVAPTA